MLGRRLLIVLACAAFVAANVPIPQSRINEDNPQIVEAFQDQLNVNFRLPNNTRPISYDVHLNTNVHLQTDFGFSGQVVIRFVVLETSRTITLHHRQLTIGTASLVAVSNPNTPIALNAFEYDPTSEFLTYTLSLTDLIVGSEYFLTIAYSGVLRTDENGFYRSSYLADDGSRRWLATTQFESTNARHGFPCYDEPRLRAYFSLRITHGSNYHALSNMPVEYAVANGQGLTTTQFNATSAPTPTYLIAFIVSDFESKSGTNSNGFVQRVFARPNAIHDGDYGLDTGLKVLDAFEKYFGIPFAFPKMDQVAVPDFEAGAMENWGLVTYRELLLLYNETISTFYNKQRIAVIIAHEYAHQWFGNHVTPAWWTYIWLNEGFATLFENYAVDWVFPEWKILDAFVPNVVQSVMVYDATANTRPMTHYVESSQAISNLFDNVAYSKSGCVLRMLLNAFTEESFKRGLISYLNAKSNSYAVEEDLFAELERAVKMDGTLAGAYNVTTIFSSWTRQAGYPLVEVTRNYETGDVALSQERYLAVNGTTPNTSLWWIPINIATASAADFSLTAATSWFSTRTLSFKDDSIGNTDWLLLNKRQTGYYRVKYDAENYKLLANQLVTNFSAIHLASRSNLIDDAFELARTERLDYDVVFDLSKYLEHEVEFVPWASFFRGLELVNRLYAGSDKYEKFTIYIRKQMAHLFEEVGIKAADNEHHFRKQIRNLVIEWACRYGSTECLNGTNSILSEFVATSVRSHQDHWAVVVANGYRNATADQIAQLLGRLSIENDQEERHRLITALAYHSDIEVANDYLSRTMLPSNTIFRSEDERYRAFSDSVGVSQKHASMGIGFLLENLDAVNVTYGMGRVNDAIVRLSSFVVSDERENEFQQLVELILTRSYMNPQTIVTARANIASNKRWTSRNSAAIDDWIDHNGAGVAIVSALLMTVLLLVTQLL